MTNPAYTHLAFLLDASGSMSQIASDVEGGFNAFIDEQKATPGRCTVSLSDFSTHGDYRKIHEGIDIAAVAPLKIAPRGYTALYDALGRMIGETGAWLAELPEDERPGLVIFGIMTDGHENDSVELTAADVKKLIETQETQFSWTFNYLGANQDAIEQGATMGVRADSALTYSNAGAGATMGAYSGSVTRMRSVAASGADVNVTRSAGAYTEAERLAAMAAPQDDVPPTQGVRMGLTGRIGTRSGSGHDVG